MTATETKSVTRCRLCGTPLHLSDMSTITVWVDEQGWDSCEDTFKTHEPTPICRANDQILPWVDKDGRLNIREGDLVLREYRMEVIDRLYWNPAENILRSGRTRRPQRCVLRTARRSCRRPPLPHRGDVTRSRRLRTPRRP